MSLKNHWWIMIFLIVFSIPVIWPIIIPGYFPIHDDNQVARVFEMHQALTNREFPPRWANDLGFGYGYPIFNFYNPLPYYFGASFMFLGFNALAAAKFMFTFPIVFSLFSMYIFSRIILNKWGAILAGIFYIYAPYHGVQIFVRGSVAEYWAYAILPLLFWAIWKKKFFAFALSLTALILSHNLTAFMSIPFILFIILIKLFTLANKKNKLLLLTSYFLFFASALGLSAFFWLPAIIQSKFTLVDQMVFQEFDPPALHIVQPFQLWSSPWGYGGSSSGIDDGLSLQLGKIHLLGSFLGILMLLFVIARNLPARNAFSIADAGGRRGNLDRHATSWLAMTGFGLLFSLFMLLPYSVFIWNNLKFLSYIQFPWRFLAFASLFSSLLAAISITFVIESIGKKINKNLFSPVLYLISYLLYLIFAFKFFQPQFKYSATAKELTSKNRLIWEVSFRSYEYLPQGFAVPQNKEIAIRIDNYQNKLLIEKFKQKTRLLQNFSNIISLIALIVLIGYYFYAKSRNYRRNPG